MKTKKRLLNILLSLVLMLGVMPGMSLTAYAASTETLLTTITGTGSNTSPVTSANVSYSTEGVATLTFSGSVIYQASPAWGWWGYGWTATVAPADGYTITKCVFYDDANRTATDSEAPFVVETTEDDKTPKVNGTTINSSSKGIKKIEVYGYATPAHTHEFTYSASGATITATCVANCPNGYDTTPATLTIAANGGTYDGTTAYSATVTNNIPTVTGDTVSDITYYKVDTQGATTGGTAQTGAPTNAGYYYASVTLTSGSNSYTAVKAFTVAKADPTVPTDLTATYGQTLANIELPDGWTWVDSSQSAGNVVSPAATFKANFAGDDNYNAASNVDVAVTVAKADPTPLLPEGFVVNAEPGDTLAANESQLPEGWVWVDGTAGVGNDEGTFTFPANYTGSSNYDPEKQVPVTVKVSKAYYEYVTGSSSGVWTKGSSGTLLSIFRRTQNDKKTFDSFLSASCDGNPMTKDDQYTIEQGSLKIYLKDSMLNTLSAGTHTLMVAFSDGEATTTFEVKEKSSGGDSSNTTHRFPKTGIE